MPQLRLVLNTNVVVSGIVYPKGSPGRILNLWRNGSLDVSLSHYILEEAARVLPKLSRVRVEATEARDVLDSLTMKASIVEPDQREVPELRDKDDQQVLGTFVAAKADYLITGDKDLLVLADRYAILTPAQFLEKHT